MPPGIIRLLSAFLWQNFQILGLDPRTPNAPSSDFPFLATITCTFFQPKTEFLPTPLTKSLLRVSERLCPARALPYLPLTPTRLSPPAVRPSASDSSRCAAPSFSPWLQKRLHSFAKISPIMSTWAGRGVPQQQVPLRRAPHRGTGRGAPR